jgi:hypothetical protein
MTTITQIAWAQSVGQYAPTTIDQQKQNADFRILSVNPHYIRWKDGKSETVTKRQLKKLKTAHTWATDF